MKEKKDDDIFRCGHCGKEKTRKELLKRWVKIPFGREEEKRYYCGCHGWN